MKYFYFFIFCVSIVAFMVGCNPKVISTPTLAITDTPLPTLTNTFETFPTLMATTIPKLDVTYDLTFRCEDGKAIYHITFKPVGGTGEYTFSPSETFIARPGDLKEATVTSADQVWHEYIPIIENTCKQHNNSSTDSNGTSAGPGESNNDPAPVVPECIPLGNSGKCKKK